ncbi:hypothetical protein G7066_12750 [Leucobacter coleopterorum]|uniref:Uncharacterized protein n=1 Tax=Leucobacter coleopterorum TaxID=2714933 RepID=A0ABX6K1Z8_9MICO|nr:hypothetical protein [Leucobacter coleopterorum]QIM19219.1 hypothetical protein G7066_12750 [Leucobacter coleopterorum]
MRGAALSVGRFTAVLTVLIALVAGVSRSPRESISGPEHDHQLWLWGGWTVRFVSVLD